MSSAPVPATSCLLSYEVCNRLVQLTIGERLVEKSVRPFLHCLHCCCLVRQGRDHEDPYRGFQLHQFRYALDSIHLRHGEIHRHHIRIHLPEQLDGLESITGCTDQLQLVELLRALDTSAHDIRIVDDHQLIRPFCTAVHLKSICTHDISL